MKIGVKVVIDKVDKILKATEALQKQHVLVGVPENKNDRREDDGIGNATIMFIAEFGSPANNIPARPVLTIGIDNSKDQVAEEYKIAAKAAWAGNLGAVNHAHRQVGMKVADAVKRVISDQEDILDPSYTTLEAREASGIDSVDALFVTGQFRRSISYLIEDKRK